MPQFQRFDPADCQFPRPGAPLLPVLRWADLTLGRRGTVAQDVLDGPGARHFARGRYALRAAYRLAGVGPSGALLAPGYHCRTMLDPALALGGAVLFYAQHADLGPDMDSIRQALASRPGAVKALIVPHYFGIEQAAGVMEELAALCRLHGVMLVEDCSHAWQVALKRLPVCQAGSGHLLVASPYKFFACEDGGVLWGNPAQLSGIATARPGLLSELKALKAGAARSRQGSAAPAPDALPLPEAGRRGQDWSEHSEQPSGMYESAQQDLRCLALSRWVMGRTRLDPVVQQRQRYYHQWLRAVAGLPGGRALLPELAPDSAPYMFPLLITQPESQFYVLKQAGVPIWRWDEMAVSECAVAGAYRLRLLHLPCHQSLSAGQMQWMTGMVARVLA
ncbi:MAG: DegT/DnrJ/EryC1/StrS family aminotransferase [Pseudomonadota bacterium]